MTDIVKRNGRWSLVKPKLRLRHQVGLALRAIRENLGLNQTTLATAVGVTQATWSRIEEGKLALNIDKLEAAAIALDVQPEEIFDLARQFK